MEKTKIAIIGGDERAIETAAVLLRAGTRVALFGFEEAPADRCGGADLKDCEEPYTIEEALDGAKAALLPIPAVKDGFLNAVFATNRIGADALLALNGRGLLVFGGRLAPEPARADGVGVNSGDAGADSASDAGAVRGTAGKTARGGDPLQPSAHEAPYENAADHPPARALRGNRVIDLLRDEEFARDNALPTAEGAIGLTLLYHRGLLSGASCAVLGYGRIGRELSRLLRAFSRRVTVFARREETRLQAISAGYAALPFTRFEDAAASFDLIYNTVPAPVIDADAARKTADDALYLELASAPGGFAPGARDALSASFLAAPGLPGRFSPRFAGEMIAKRLLSALEITPGAGFDVPHPRSAERPAPSDAGLPLPAAPSAPTTAHHP